MPQALARPIGSAPTGEGIPQTAGAIWGEIGTLQEGDDRRPLVVRRGLGTRSVPRQGEHQIEVDAQHVGEEIAGTRARLTLAGHPAADRAARHV